MEVSIPPQLDAGKDQNYIRKSSKFSKQRLKMRQIRKSSVLDHTMRESLPQTNSMIFVRYMGLKENFQLETLLNRMVLLKGKT